MAQSTKVFVGSLPPTKPEELRRMFENYGVVVECDVMNRCGFVHMETLAMAKTAISALNGTEYKGQTIVVELGRPKEKKKGPVPPKAGAVKKVAKGQQPAEAVRPAARVAKPNGNVNVNRGNRQGGNGMALFDNFSAQNVPNSVKRAAALQLAGALMELVNTNQNIGGGGGAGKARGSGNSNRGNQPRGQQVDGGVNNANNYVNMDNGGSMVSARNISPMKQQRNVQYPNGGGGGGNMSGRNMGYQGGNYQDDNYNVNTSNYQQLEGNFNGGNQWASTGNMNGSGGGYQNFNMNNGNRPSSNYGGDNFNSWIGSGSGGSFSSSLTSGTMGMGSSLSSGLGGGSNSAFNNRNFNDSNGSGSYDTSSGFSGNIDNNFSYSSGQGLSGYGNNSMANIGGIGQDRRGFALPSSSIQSQSQFGGNVGRYSQNSVGVGSFANVGLGRSNGGGINMQRNSTPNMSIGNRILSNSGMRMGGGGGGGSQQQQTANRKQGGDNVPNRGRADNIQNKQRGPNISGPGNQAGGAIRQGGVTKRNR